MANTKWKDYEGVATYLLNEFAKEFNLDRVEGKQKIDGKRSRTTWEIDAKKKGSSLRLTLVENE